MKFCPNCDTRLKLTQDKNNSGVIMNLHCERCNFNIPSDTNVTISESDNFSEQIKVVSDESDMTPLPTIEVDCPKCGNKEAYWWMLQTRGGDEPTTQFYRCIKCNHTWREYS